VLELTRLGIENKNLKMRVESLNSRMDFDERRARALEGVVQYKPGSGPSREERPAPARYSGDSGRSQSHAQPHRPQPVQHQAPQPQQQAPQPPSYSRPEARPEAPADMPIVPASQSVQGASGTEPAADGSGTVRRRRRRRRGRRGGRGRAQGEMTNAAGTAPAGVDAVSSTPPHGDSTADAALDDPNGYEGGDQDMDSGSDSGDDEGPDTAQ
jgi:ribonuclease E